MANKTNHTQVKMRHDNGLFDTAYIPSEYAVVGRRIGIKEDGKWDDHWTVIECYQTLDSNMVKERSQDFKQTRKASDI